MISQKKIPLELTEERFSGENNKLLGVSLTKTIIKAINSVIIDSLVTN